MIRYDLICDQGHSFDGWFRDSAAFDAQLARHLVTCSKCGSEQVQKQLMTPGVPVKANRRSDGAAMAAAVAEPTREKMLALMREMRRTVEANSEYVGERFAEEARRIHYAEVEPRGIYGEAKLEDAKALIEEGIDVHPLPRLPEDSH
jgi:hypothetical protein